MGGPFLSPFMSTELPVIHWKAEGRGNDTEKFRSVEVQAGPAEVVWILRCKFWFGHDRQ